MYPSWTETVSRSELRNQLTVSGSPISILEFGGSNNGTFDNSSAITSALQAASAKKARLHFPATSTGNTYRFSTPITTFSNLTITCDDSVVFIFSGTTGAAVNLTGTRVKVILGEIAAPTAPYAVRYYNLEFSDIVIRRPGMCQHACIYHDGDLQTNAAGNNRWTIGDVQAGNVPYGIRLKENPSYLLEGELWDVKVVFSATNTALRIGESSANQRIRWNVYRIAVDAQGITPLLVDVHQNSNTIELINWQGLTIPPNGHVRFNAGTSLNNLIAQSGVQNQLTINDLGTNAYTAPGTGGQILMGARLAVGTLGASATNLVVQAGRSSATGDNFIGIENTNATNVTTKWVGYGIRGRDTTQAGKDVCSIRAQPVDGDWVSSRIEIYGRRGNILLPQMILGGAGLPNNVVTASVGAIYTRSDGGAGSTLYVKESGDNTNTGWVAK